MNVRFMGSMGLALKQAIVLGVGAAGVIALTAFAVVGSHGGLIAERKAHTRHLVEAATALIAHFEKRAEDGGIPVEIAKKEAIAAVQALRTGDDNYFWVIDHYPRMILHPYFPDLQSKSLRDFRDDDGQPLFNDMVRIVESQGSGFLSYYWPHPGETKPVRKLSYVTAFDPWGWIIGSGLYYDDIDAALLDTAKTKGGVAVAILVLVLVGTFLLTRSITTPLRTIGRRLGQLSAGNLNVVFPGTDRADEIGVVARAVDAFRKSLGERAELLGRMEDGNKALRESESRFVAFINNAPDDIVLKDTEGRFVMVNKRFAEFIGVPPEAIVGHRIGDFVSSDVSAFVEDRDEQVLRLKAPVEYEQEDRMPDGSRRVVSVVKFPVFGDDGTVRGIGMLRRDISNRKKDEATLAERERLLALLIDSVPANVALFSADERYRFVNRRYETMFDRVGGEIIGRHVRDIVGEAGYGNVAPHLKKALGGEIAMVETDLEYPRMGMRRMQVTLVPDVDVDGAVQGVFSIAFDVTEIRRVSEELKRAESTLAAAIQASPAGIVVADGPEGIIRLANKAVCDMTGVSCDRLIGSRMEEQAVMWESLSADGTLSLSRAVRNGAVVRDDEAVLRRDDGEDRWVLANAAPTFDSDGRIVGSVVVLVDITERKHIEQRLRQAEAIIQTGPVVAFLWRNAENWPVEYVSANVERVFGHSADDFALGRVAYSSLIHPDDIERVGREVQEASADPDCMAFQHEPYRIITAQGEIRWLDDSTVIRRDADGRVTHYQGIVVDITDRRLSEHASRESEERYRALSETSPDAILLLRQGVVMYANAAASKLLGVAEPADLVGVAMETFSPEDDPSNVAQSLHHLLVYEPPYQPVEIEIRRCDGQAIMVEVSAARVHLGGDTVVQAVLHDVTERRRMENQMQRAHRLQSLGQLTGGVAHDFNNILAVILGNAEILEEDFEDDPDAKAAISAISRAAIRGSSLTGRLLAFARRQDLRPERVDPNRMIVEMEEMLRRSLGEHIEISIESPETISAIEVDSGQFENALLNLAVNARDAMPEGGKLTFELAERFIDAKRDDVELQPGRYVVLSVTDSGIGMPPEVQDRIFEPFFTTKGGGSGTGLGLSMVYGFVRQSGGDVRVHSAPGEGTSFDILLPAAKTQAREADPDIAENRDKTKWSLPLGSVLLVEDDPNVRIINRKMLQSMGVRVIEATNAIQAIDILGAADDVELLFTDVVMPGGRDGRWLAEQSRKLRPDIRVLLCSGYARGRVKNNDLRPGQVAFISKPFTKEQLSKEISNLFADR